MTFNFKHIYNLRCFLLSTVVRFLSVLAEFPVSGEMAGCNHQFELLTQSRLLAICQLEMCPQALLGWQPTAMEQGEVFHPNNLSLTFQF